MKTKGRRLLTAANLPVPMEFLGPDVSMSSGHSPKGDNFQSPSAGTPPRRNDHFIGTPLEQSPPFPAFTGFATPQEERWENGSVGGSQAASEVAAVLQELKESRKQDNELRRKELEILLEATRKKDPVKVASIFQVKPQAALPKMGDKDHDVESHMEEFEDLCNLANPNDNVAPAERLRLWEVPLREQSYAVIEPLSKRPREMELTFLSLRRFSIVSCPSFIQISMRPRRPKL